MKTRQPTDGMTRQQAVASNLAVLVGHVCKKQQYRLRRSKPLQRPRADSADLGASHDHQQPPPPSSGKHHLSDIRSNATAATPTLHRSLSTSLAGSRFVSARSVQPTAAATTTRSTMPSMHETSQPPRKKKPSSGGALLDMEYNATTDSMALDSVVSCLVQ